MEDKQRELIDKIVSYLLHTRHDIEDVDKEFGIHLTEEQEVQIAGYIFKCKLCGWWLPTNLESYIGFGICQDCYDGDDEYCDESYYGDYRDYMLSE